MNEEVMLNGFEEEIQGFVEEAIEGAGDEELLGALRRVKTRGKQPAKVIAQSVARSVKARTLASVETRDQKFLVAKNKDLDEDTQRQLAKGNLKHRDMDFYFRERITGAGGIIEIVKPSNVFKRGVTNLNENTLPALINLVLSKIRVGFGQAIAGGTTDPALVSYVNENTVTSGVGSVPEALVNGHLVVKVDDQPIVDLPIAKFFNNSTTPMGNAIQGLAMDSVDLKGMKLIKSKQRISVEIQFAEGHSMPAAGTQESFVEVRLMGSGTHPGA